MHIEISYLEYKYLSYLEYRYLWIYLDMYIYRYIWIYPIWNADILSGIQKVVLQIKKKKTNHLDFKNRQKI